MDLKVIQHPVGSWGLRRADGKIMMKLVIESWSTPDALKGERRRVLVAHYYNWGNTNIQTLSWK